jgi:MoaD family protein
MIRVLYYAWVREKTGTNETRVEGFSSRAHAGTIVELVQYLEEHYGVFLIDANSSKSECTKHTDLLSVLIIMINGRHIAHVGGLDAPVSDGDVVSIFPMIGGG